MKKVYLPKKVLVRIKKNEEPIRYTLILTIHYETRSFLFIDFAIIKRNVDDRMRNEKRMKNHALHSLTHSAQ